MRAALAQRTCAARYVWRRTDHCDEGSYSRVAPMKERIHMKAILAVVAAVAMSPAALSAAPPTPAEFVAKASESGMAEVELGKLAAKKGASDAVRQYGQKMVTDHTKANAELAKLAAPKGLKPAKAMNAMHAKALKDLSAKAGADFDAAYAQQMVIDHDQAVALFTAASALPDRDLAGFAARTLPVLQAHNDAADQLHGPMAR